MILLDANILLRMADSKDSKYAVTRAAVFKLRQSNALVIVPQSIYEFCAVASRARANNGLEMDTVRVARWMVRYRSMFQLLPEPPELLTRWHDLIVQFQVKGFQVHDTRYVAAMQCFGISSFMTFNEHHFKRFPIAIINPDSVQLFQ